MPHEEMLETEAKIRGTVLALAPGLNPPSLDLEGKTKRRDPYPPHVTECDAIKAELVVRNQVINTFWKDQHPSVRGV